MDIERRKAKRVGLEIEITLNEFMSDGKVKARSIKVNTSDISSSGIGIETAEKLEVGAFYDTVVKLPTNEVIETVIEVVRVADAFGGLKHYGCRFVGLGAEAQFRIDVYQIVQTNAH